MTEDAVVIDNENWLPEKQIKSNVFATELAYVFSKKKWKASVSAYGWLCDFTHS
jgi:hypothetical protein